MEPWANTAIVKYGLPIYRQSSHGGALLEPLLDRVGLLLDLGPNLVQLVLSLDNSLVILLRLLPNVDGSGLLATLHGIQRDVPIVGVERVDIGVQGRVAHALWASGTAAASSSEFAWVAGQQCPVEELPPVVLR